MLVGLLSLGLAIVLMAVRLVSRTETFLPVATTALAMWTMVSLKAGSHVRIADWLGERLSTPATSTIVYSFAYDWFALASLALLFALFMTGGVAFIALRRQASRPEAIEGVARLYPDLIPNIEGLGWIRRIVRSRALASLTDQAASALLAMLSRILVGAIAFYGIRTRAPTVRSEHLGRCPTPGKALSRLRRGLGACFLSPRPA